MQGDNTRPIIIRRKKVVEGGHHGGAWKVAYADFVTAMMAFFMLMWLLNATTEKQRKGLADYFSPTIAVSRASGGGDGALGGRSLSSDASNVQLGRGGITTTETHGTTEAEGEMAAIEAAILGKGGDNLLNEDQLRHVTLRRTDEGVVIELFDLPGSPLFDGAAPAAILREIVTQLAGRLSPLPNALAINGYTAAEPIVTRTPAVWSTSTERAQALRRLLPESGLADARVARVTGHADRRPAVADPLAERNNRLEIVVLTGRPSR
ncbi:MAG: flagellar motor protein MotB [Pseudomonadota bacterium]